MADSLAMQNLTSSLTGNLPKAILFVRDINSIQSGKDEEMGMISGNIASELSQSLLNEAAEAALNGGVVQTFDSLGGSRAYDGFVGMEVQYNPSSIKLDTQAGKQVTNSESGLNQANGQITELVQDSVTSMSFQLIFDDMNPSDAFMINSFSFTGNLLTQGSNLVKKAKGEAYSVKDQIEGLLSLLVSRATRQVVFFWSNMCFRGEVTNISATYTMFNPQGNPIRGTVQLSIRQGSTGDGTGYNYDYEEKYWRKAFEQAFDENGMAGLRSTADKIMQNNFLNVNI